MGEMFSEAFLEHVKHAVPISEVVGQYVVWDKSKSRDGDMWACCPFHSEGDPSFHAEDDRGIYKCFACDAGGDHFKFLTDNQGLSFPDAVRLVAELGGVSLPDAPSPAPKREPDKPQEQKPETQSKSAARKACKREAVVTYDYTDNDGNLLYQVVRYQFRKPDGAWLLAPSGNPDKTFLQRREVNGETVWNLDGVGHTIYRHPQIEIAIAESKPVFIVEGEKDVETLEGFGLIATTNSGGVENWDKKHAALFKGASVIIIGDNDEAGIAGVLKRATSLKGIAHRVRVLDLGKAVSGFPNKGDITDWRDKFGGDKAALIEMVKALPDWRQGPPVSKLGSMKLSSVGEEAKKHQWLVHDMIELMGSAAFAGFSQSGKSFMMIELAFCVATGKKFWGKDVMQGLVVYQTGEGDRGFMKRVQGYMADRGIDDPETVPLVIMPKKINLFVDDTDMNTVIEELKAWREYYDMPLRLFVIDTFNKATRGANEISGLDMGKVIDRIERIAEACQCTVMVVDHLSQQGRFRGHGSKTGDLTNVIMVETTDRTDRNGRKIRRMRLDKNKDGENGNAHHFVLRQVVVGYDDLNRPITTCVVEEPDGNEEELDKSGRLSLNQATVLQTLRDIIGREGIDPPEGVTGVPQGRRVVAWKKFHEELRKKWTFTAPETEPEKRASELQRVLADSGKRLTLAGFIDKDNDRNIVWWTGKRDRAVATPKPVADALPAGINAEISEAAKAGVPFI